MKHVYLAGPISGTSYAEATGWRHHVARLFLDGIVGVSPMRMKEWCRKVELIRDVAQYQATATEAEFLLSGESHAICTRDHYDVSTVDLVLAYLPKEFNDRRPSWGTAIEIGWASHERKPIVLVTDDDALSAHPLVRESVGWIVPSLELGAEAVNSVLGAYL